MYEDQSPSSDTNVGKIQVCVPVIVAEIILDLVRLALRYSRSYSVTRTTTTMPTASSALYEKTLECVGKEMTAASIWCVECSLYLGLKT